MFELFLSKTPNKEASPAVARKPLHPAKKFSSQFLICARRFFSSKRKRKLFCGVLLLTSRTAGLSAFCIRSGVAEFPPNPPSAFLLLKRNGNGKHERAKIPSPQPPSFLPACLGFAPKTFRRDYSSILTKQVLCKLSIVSITQIVFCTSVFKSASEI